MVDRRTFLGQSGAAAALLLFAAPRIAVAQAATDRRFVFVIQRGAADGLGTLAPTADPAFASLRGPFAEEFAGGARIGDYTLHPVLASVASLAAAREALFVHAIASPYRDRSHFDGQNVLETGGRAAYALRDGWLNRLLGLLPGGDARAIAVSATVPMVLRGGRDVASYAPSALPDASDDLLARVGALYQGDAALHAAWAQAMQTRAVAGDLAGTGGRNGAATGALAARLLSGANGARIAVIESAAASASSCAGSMRCSARSRPGSAPTGRALWSSSPPNSAAPPRPTAPAAPITAPARSPCCSAAPSPAAASLPTGRGSARHRSTRAAISGPRSPSTGSSPARSPSITASNGRAPPAFSSPTWPAPTCSTA
jgi:uncharacterized protein (DUF1501 family)